MPLRAVIFDLDDTLHDKSATLRVVGRRLHADHRLAAAGVDRDVWVARFVAVNNARIDKPTAFARLRADFGLSAARSDALLRDCDASLGQQAQAFTGAIACLAACRAAGLRLAVVTNGRDAFQRSKLAGLGALPLLDAVFTSEGFGARKPDPAIFAACLAALGSDAAETAVVGDDRCCDIDPALQWGGVAVWKTSRPATDVALASDDFPVIQAYLLAAAAPAPG